MIQSQISSSCFLYRGGDPTRVRLDGLVCNAGSAEKKQLTARRRQAPIQVFPRVEVTETGIAGLSRPFLLGVERWNFWPPGALANTKTTTAEGIELTFASHLLFGLGPNLSVTTMLVTAMLPVMMSMVSMILTMRRRVLINREGKGAYAVAAAADDCVFVTSRMIWTRRGC